MVSQRILKDILLLLILLESCHPLFSLPHLSLSLTLSYHLKPMKGYAPLVEWLRCLRLFTGNQSDSSIKRQFNHQEKCWQNFLFHDWNCLNHVSVLHFYLVKVVFYLLLLRFSYFSFFIKSNQIMIRLWIAMFHGKNLLFCFAILYFIERQNNVLLLLLI